MTEKLYYIDSHMSSFSAVVTGCEQVKKGWAVTLDRTAFFPEGGGQPADTGTIGAAHVLDVQERAGEILHVTDTPLQPGEAVECGLAMEQRLRRMQNHSGEHIVSGLTHRLYSLNNVGFHMGEKCMTVDFDGELSWEQLMRLETLANEAVRANVPIIATFPSPEELEKLDYRSKLELTEDVRIVEIQGIDLCACCAPHVTQTGEIGVIKILDAQRHRGGVRVSLICGMDALEDYRLRQEEVTEVSRLLSAKRDEVPQAVQRLHSAQEQMKERLSRLSAQTVQLMAESYERREGNICIFDELLDEIALRELVNRLTEKCSGIAAAFSGNDGDGYRYIIGSRHMDLRANAKAIHAGIGGRGGGTPTMIQGQAVKSAKEIEEFVKEFCLDKSNNSV